MGGPLSDILALNAPGIEKMKNENLGQFPLYFLNKSKSANLGRKESSNQFVQEFEMFLKLNFTTDKR